MMVDPNGNQFKSPESKLPMGPPYAITTLFWVLNSSLAILSFLLISLHFAIPVFNAMYEGIGPNLPWITRITLFPFVFHWLIPTAFPIVVIWLNWVRFKSSAKSYKPLLLAVAGGVILYIVGLYGLYAPILNLPETSTQAPASSSNL